jgi:hypothetical protein
MQLLVMAHVALDAYNLIAERAFVYALVGSTDRKFNLVLSTACRARGDN